MIRLIKNFFYARNQMKKFMSSSISDRKLVFYSEGKNYWIYFEKIIDHLIQNKITLTYLTSERTDPVLLNSSSYIKSFYIGDGTIRTICFATMEAEMVLMTMPDLDNLYIKKSPMVKNYIYIHHSIVSQHMIYNQKAFDNFDIIFCVGHHHINENLKIEEINKIPNKDLVKHGYDRLDQLLQELNSDSDTVSNQNKLVNNNHSIHVLIAPSWGPDTIINRIGKNLITKLLNNNFVVTLRPHPQTLKYNQSLIRSILKKYSDNDNFYFDNNISATRSLRLADIMISDWSGAAFEFAFARLRPVLFIDVPLKINNHDYKSYNIEPIEIKLRNKIGSVLSENKLDDLPNTINHLISDKDNWREKIKKIRAHTVYNIKNSGKSAGDWLISKIQENNAA